SSHDLIVIGAGPAGAAAAVAATACGLSVLVLDEGQAGGGRIHRPPDSWREHSGTSQVGSAEGRALRAELSSCGAELAFEHCVWHVGLLPGNADHPPRFEISVLAPEGQRQAQSRALVLATGAIERFYPRPGWTLPGVVGLGAAALMLKAGGVLPGRHVAVVGPGALAISVAKLIVDAGGEVVAICDPNPLRAWAEALLAMARPLGGLARGGAWLAGLALKGVPM